MTNSEQETAYQLWRLKQDPLLFLKEATFTLDQAAAATGMAIRPFPADKPYVPVVVRAWEQEPILVIKKSRRMIITWLMCALHTWFTIFRRGCSVFLVSKKEEDSDELVKRCEFIFDNIPDYVMPVKPEKQSRFCHLGFPGLHSFIKGVPQGADQLRQHTASRIFFDEFAFWTEAQATYEAARPTLQGGGRLTIASSVGPGFMQRLLEGDV